MLSLTIDNHSEYYKRASKFKGGIMAPVSESDVISEFVKSIGIKYAGVNLREQLLLNQ